MGKDSNWEGDACDVDFMGHREESIFNDKRSPAVVEPDVSDKAVTILMCSRRFPATWIQTSSRLLATLDG